MRIDTQGSAQITVPHLAQITVSQDRGQITIDLVGESQQIIQEGARLTIQMNPLLAFTAPEARREVAELKGIEPYQYIRIDKEREKE
jgi:hypothetical protein